MKVWQYTKKPQMVLNQRFVAFYVNIIYTLFYALSLKGNYSNGLEVFGAMLYNLSYCIRLCILLIVVNPQKDGVIFALITHLRN